ncbi:MULTISPECIES: response regulator transcription factor [Actinokineospora]|uniref:DNA-binding response regulator n=1 Tax=Actinokineospora fastidiosa TaxID=1816 RepID=A0A918LH82_9PSEU|nr:MULTISPECIES: response regulator transcription factor [Actinokineospora]UVS78805.1 Transcriptional regulatory protein LiaR [Actinokineospora sp. UTMC 2448]GGS47239.1 DNA-binding response regulator [Actinokineospora fastidiosa]
MAAARTNRYSDRTTPVAVVLADAHPLVRTGLRVVLEADPALRVVGEAVSMSSLTMAVRTHRPAVAVVDVELPGVDAAADPARAKARLGDLPAHVLLVGETCDPELVLRLVTDRVRGFVRKSSPPPELSGAVAAVAGGHASLPVEVAGRLLDSYLLDASGHDELDVPLTRRERDVLRLMVEGNSTAEIASALVVQTSTVKSHIYHLLRKLGVNDRAQAVALAYRSGMLRSTIAQHSVTG